MVLDKVKKLFKGEEDSSLLVDKTGQPSKEDLQIACGVILLEMSGRDEDYAPEEVQAIFASMREKFQIEEEQDILDLLKKAQNLKDSKGEIDLFIDQINENYSEAQRKQILQMASEVMQADGAVERDEQKFLKQISVRLKLPQD